MASSTESVVHFQPRRPGGGPDPLDRRGRPMHDLRISVMDRCNFRCPYCMPEDKYHKDFQFLPTGGEALVRRDRAPRAALHRARRAQAAHHRRRAAAAARRGRPRGDLSRIAGIEDVALTTNGILLAKHAAALKANGLKRVTVSLDSLDEQVFRSHERRPRQRRPGARRASARPRSRGPRRRSRSTSS
jgi:GTP 3',8-cyclase